MAHPTRGHRSGTYDIQELVAVDPDDLSITYRTAAAFQPQTRRLTSEPTVAARQLLQAMADSIKVSDNGDAFSGWESEETLRRAMWYSKVMLEVLHASGVTDFADPAIDVPLLRSLYQPFDSNTKRSACWLLARVVRDNHPNGPAISTVLKNTRFRVEDADPFTYDDAVADAIDKAARGVYKERFDAQRHLFTALGYDTSSRSWLRIPAEEIIDRARDAHPEVTKPEAPQPSQAAPIDVQVAWAVTHPWRFGYQKHRKNPGVRGLKMQEIGVALYPDSVTITAAVILHCLGENAGYNLSVILGKNAESLTYLGPDDALEHNVKSRNRTQDTRPTRLVSIYTPGGVIESLSGLTRFSRHARSHLTTPAGAAPDIVDRLYVEHTSDPADAAVIDSNRMQHAWRKSSAWNDHWDTAAAGPRSEAPLRTSALRLVAQRRAMADGLKADVHGHTDRTKTHYLANVLSDFVFNKHAVAAQDSFHDVAVEDFNVVADATAGPAADLAAVAADQVMDMEIGVCASNGKDPDGSGRRCGLGIVACFTCPNGFRTVDHIPGLLAAVELADIIKRNDPDEWENGQASPLRFYAQACLDQYPPMVVGNVRRSTDLVPHILTVTGMYMELRNG